MKSVTVGLMLFILVVIVLVFAGCSKPNPSYQPPETKAADTYQVPTGSCMGTWESDTIAGKFRLKIEQESKGSFGLVPDMIYKIRWWSMPDGFGGKVYVEESGKTTEYRISGVLSRDGNAIRLTGYGDGGFGDNQEMDFKRSQFE